MGGRATDPSKGKPQLRVSLLLFLQGVGRRLASIGICPVFMAKSSWERDLLDVCIEFPGRPAVQMSGLPSLFLPTKVCSSQTKILSSMWRQMASMILQPSIFDPDAGLCLDFGELHLFQVSFDLLPPKLGR